MVPDPVLLGVLDGPRSLSRKSIRLILAGLFLVFFAVAWPDLGRPFTSVHYVRQNHTYDISRRVFQEGWSAVLTPKMSFSLPENAQVPFTVARMDFPFHGLLGWPWAAFFPGREREIVRLISLAVAAVSMGLFFRILRFWHDPHVSLVICAMWILSPLLLHLGQIPMPDIFATTFMMAAFAFSLRGGLMGSACSFLMALLAKVSVIVYGLPILAALILARKPGGIIPAIRLSVRWGLLPLAGLALWIALGQNDPPASWQIIGGVPCGERGLIRLEDLLSFPMYIPPLAMLLAFGCGVLGIAFLAASSHHVHPTPGAWLVVCVLVAIVAQYLLMRISWLEFQYTLPVLFWVLWLASFGVAPFLKKVRHGFGWRIAFFSLLVGQVSVSLVCSAYLKKSRVSNIEAIEAAQKFLPENARVIVFAFVGGTATSPPVWLKCNTLSLCDLANPSAPWDERGFVGQVERLRGMGFEYLAVFDTDTRQRLASFLGPPSFETDHAVLGSSVRRFCESKFRLIYQGNRIVLYGLK